MEEIWEGREMEMICPKCKKSVDARYNYCPVCGEPLSDLAKKREELKLSNAGYMKLNELAAMSNDPAVLAAINKLMELE